MLQLMSIANDRFFFLLQKPIQNFEIEKLKKSSNISRMKIQNHTNLIFIQVENEI